MATILIIAIIILVAAVAACKVFFNINLSSYLTVITGLLAKNNVRKAVVRVKHERIRTKKPPLSGSYNGLVDVVLKNMGLNMTIEGFNIIAVIVCTIVIIAAMAVFKNMLLSTLLTIAGISALFTFLVVKSRDIERKRNAAVDDTVDMLCPLARDGVEKAIDTLVNTRGSISPMILIHFQDFLVDIEDLNYTFETAMQNLEAKLGPRFSNFAQKAILFENKEKKGYADIFYDIVDENKTTREVNYIAYKSYKKSNNRFMVLSSALAGFICYSLTGNELRGFLLGSSGGRILLGIALVIILAAYSVCQLIQGDIFMERRGR